MTLAPWGLAQPTSPHIGYVYPAGGRQGAVFQVAVGGQYLNNATNAYISGPGVQAVVVDYSRPLTQKEFNDLREKLKELQEKRAAANGRGRGGQAGSQSGTNAVWTAADERMIAEMRQKLILFAPRRNGESGDCGNRHGPGDPGAGRRARRTGAEAGDADRVVQSAPFLRRPIGGIQQAGCETQSPTRRP